MVYKRSTDVVDICDSSLKNWLYFKLKIFSLKHLKKVCEK